jgi:membrane AbrB-like protein
LTGTALLTVSDVVSTALPWWVSNIGQLLLGWSLGDRYRPAFFKAAPRFLSGVAIFTTGSLFIVGLIGWGVSFISDLSLFTIWLGMAPGGLAEMAITAKVLQLGVPLVTAMQVSRMAFVVMVTGWIYQRWLAVRVDKDGPPV